MEGNRPCSPNMNDTVDEINPRLREMFLSDGNSALLEAKDPYGLWSISWKNGKTPGRKEQSFTSAAQASQWYLHTWLAQNRYDTKIVDAVEIPVVQTKKVVNGESTTVKPSRTSRIKRQSLTPDKETRQSQIQRDRQSHSESKGLTHGLIV